MDVRIVETRIHRSPFGVRCVDSVTRQPVRTGLAISVRPLGMAGRPVIPFLTRSGIYGFEGVSGLWQWETDESAALPAVNYLLLCEDGEGRFLPFSHSLGAPNVQKPLPLPLFSAPARPAVPGITVIRGHVEQVQGANRPLAAYVKIDAQYAVTPAPATPPATYTALSDYRGEFAIFLPTPDPGSQPSNPAAALVDQTWPLTLTFSYQPGNQQYAYIDLEGHSQIVDGPVQSDLDARRTAGWRCLPDLMSVLSQTAVSVYDTTATTATTLTVQVPFGRGAAAMTPASADNSIWLAA